MLKLHTCIRSLVACSATILVAGSAAAASSDFLGFFESIFDDDSNGGRRTGASITVGADGFFGATVIDGINVVDTGASYSVPTDDCPRLFCPPDMDDPWPDMGGGTGMMDGPYDHRGAHPVPEPTSAVLFAAGAFVVARRVRR